MRYLAVRRARVGAVDLHAQELLFHQRIEDRLAQRPLDAAQTLRLFDGQPQTGHLEIFGTDTCDGRVVRHKNASRQ